MCVRGGEGYEGWWGMTGVPPCAASARHELCCADSVAAYALTLILGTFAFSSAGAASSTARAHCLPDSVAPSMESM
eukprot:16621-Chlamydomonas_euryale.AAC.5